MRSIWAIPVLASILIIGIAGFAFAIPPDLLTFNTEIFFGGSGEQTGKAIAVTDSNIFVAGTDGVGLVGQEGLLVRYDNPPSSTPNWSTTIGGGSPLFGIDATSDKVFVAGSFFPPTCGATDGVGGTEHKAGLAWFNPTTGALIGCSSPNHFGYTGSEGYQDVHVLGSSAYAVGASQGCGLTGLFTIAKYSVDTPETGILVLKTDVDNGKPTCVGGGFSIGTSIIDLNGFLYASGTSCFEAPTGTCNPVLWKYATDLNLEFRNRDATTANGLLWDITAFEDSIFAVGQTTTANSNYVIQKYSDDGTLLASVTPGGSGIDVLQEIVGIAGDGLYAIGYTDSSGAGGLDMVILKIDPANLDILSETLYGGSQDDLGRGIASGSLFVVGESKSFTEGGNGAGENDLVLLQYDTGVDDGTGPPTTPGNGAGNSDPPADPGPPAGKGRP